MQWDGQGHGRYAQRIVGLCRPPTTGANLAGFALNDNAAPRGGASSSIMLVAGAGFEPATFRL